MGTAKVKNQIKLMPVKELLGKNFNIPSYQRGYKWTKKQAEDLLNDLDEFKTSVDNKSNQDSFYCLQPLAVAPKRREVGEGFEINKYKTEQDAIIAVKKLFNKRVTWDVIDGQQRLTTIYLLLCYLGEKNLYNISYETRENSEKFLSKFLKNENDINTEASKNVDYWHIYEVYNTIKNWFEGKEDEYKLSFKRIILEETQFIWYETSEDAIKVFTRLNIGKIRLTNSELIKSMVMSHTKDVVQQYKIAGEWDMIEQQLQNDEFWYFVHSAQYDKPTRIDFLFDALCEYDIQKRIKNNRRNIIQDKNTITTYIGTDQYKTFRYYDYLLKNNGIGLYNGDVCHEIWEKIKSLFYVINEWYNDVEFYHYIGYLLCHEKININKIYQEWQNVGKKQLFKGYLKGEIKEILKSCCKQKNVGILEQQYEIDIELKEDKKQSIPKTVCRPILLLHNIQTVINQSKSATDNDEFKHFIFNRFPFHLYKTENWDVEHIDSNTTNDLKDDFSKLLWMLQFYDKMNISQANGDKPTTYKTIYYGIIEKLQNKPSASESEIKDIIKKNKDIFKDFEKLEQEIESSISDPTSKLLSYEQKNQIGNFTLLDASTNRGYGNSIFPKKRLTIMAKDRCQKYQLKFTVNGFVSELVPAPENSTFIPPVTRNVFMKYYTPETSDFTTWNTDDFNAYIGDIEKVLEEFLTDEQSTK